MMVMGFGVSIAVTVGRFQTRTVENHCHVLQHVLLIEPLHLRQLPAVDVAGTDDEDSQVGNTVDDLHAPSSYRSIKSSIVPFNIAHIFLALTV